MARSRGRGAGDEHEVSENAVSTLGLAEDDTERSLGFGIVRAAEQQLRPADDHRQGIIELMAGTGGELGERLEFFILESGLIVTDLLRQCRHDRAKPALLERSVGHDASPGLPGRYHGRGFQPRDQVGLSWVAPEAYLGNAAALRLQGNHECRGPFVALGRFTCWELRG